MRFDLKKIFFLIDNKNYFFNINFYDIESAELSYIFNKNIEKSILYLSNLKFNKNRLISAKLSNEKYGKKIIIEKIKISNNYYKKTYFLSLDEVNKYQITHFNPKTDLFARKTYNKLSFFEYYKHNIQIPTYLITNIQINLFNIYCLPLINYQKKNISIKSLDELLNINLNGNYENIFLFLRKNKAINYLEYQKKKHYINIEYMILKLKKIYFQYFNIYGQKQYKNIYSKIDNIGYISIFGLNINNNNINLNKNIGIFKIENNYININDNNIKINNIDNIDIFFHNTYEEALLMFNFKLKLILNLIDYFESLKKKYNFSSFFPCELILKEKNNFN